MAKFTIYSPTGTALYTGTPTFTGQYMKPGLLEFREVALPALVDIVPGCYVDYTRTGYRYRIYTVPQLKKQARTNSYGAAFVYQSVQLYDASKMLEYCPFRDLVTGDNRIHFSTQPSISTFEGCDGLARRFEACLQDQYGANSWVVRTATQAENPNLYDLMMEPREFTVSGLNILECLNKVYEIWPEVGWIYKVENGKDTIVIGGSGLNPNEETYAYGKGFGLTSLTRVAANADEIANRIFAYGSSRNMVLPSWYRNQDIKDAESVDIQNLMIPVSEWGLTDGERDAAKAFVEDAESIAKNGLRPATVYFDGKGEYPEIYPSLRETTIGMVRTALGDSTAKYYPSTTIYPDSNVRVDRLLSAQSAFDSGRAGADGKQSIFSEYITVSGSLSDTIPADTKILTTVIVGGSESPQSITFGASDAGIRNISMPVSISGYIQIPGITGAVLSAHLHRGHPSNAPVASGQVELTPDSSNPDRYNFVPVSVSGSKVNIAADTYYIVVELTATFDVTATATSYSYNYEGGISVSLSYYRAKTFNITLRQVGFDIGAQADLGDGKTIAMRSGDCVGRSFVIKSVQYDSTNDAWNLECFRSEDESLSQWFPNSQFGVAAGDEFVLLDIAMPDIYIKMASEKLLDSARELLADSAVERWQYTPEIDAKFMVENALVINAGETMTISDDDIIGETPDAIIVDTITINEGESAIPTYKVTLRDRKKKTWTESQSPEQSSSKSVGNITDTSDSQSSSSSESKYFTLDDSGNVTLKSQYQNLWVPGWMAAGGVGGDGGGGGGGIDLGRVWDSLTNTVADQYANTKINSAHIPIGSGLAIDSQTGLIYVTGAGTITSVAGVSPVNGDVPVASLQTALGVDILGAIAQSLQSQIDSVASRDNFDELTVTSLFADVASIRDIYAQSVGVNGLLLTNDDGVLSMNGDALLSALENEGNNIAITVGGKELTLTVGYATVSPNTRFTYTADGETHTNVEFPVDWFIAEQVSGSYRLRLNPKYIGMYAEGWIAAGGIGSGSGGGGGEGVSLVAVWRSLTNNPSLVDEDITSALDIAATHIPIGNGLSINQTTGLIDVIVQGGVTSVVGLTGDVTTEQIASALGIAGLDGNLATISACLQSLQSQIDSVASRDAFDELSATSIYSDIVSTRALYVSSIKLGDSDINATFASKLTFSANALNLVSKNDSVLTTITGANLVTVLDNNAVNNVKTEIDNSNTLYVIGVTSAATTALKRDTLVTITGGAMALASVGATGLVSAGSFKLNSGAPVLSWDSDNNAWHLTGNFYADGWVASGGIGSGSGGGTTDLLSVWESLIGNEDSYAGWGINPGHLPVISITGNGITGTGGYTYNGNTRVATATLNLALAPTGVVAGTYRSVTVDSYGRVTSGTNPTTIAQYGITDAYTKTEVDALISEMGLSTISEAIQSLQSQIDSVAARDMFDELTASVLSSDIASVNSLFVGSIALGGVDIADALSSLSSRSTSLESRATALEGRATTLEGRASALESRANTIEGAISSLEGRATTLEGRATALEGRATSLEGRATTLEGYFTDGSANSALRLTTVSKTAWGQAYWTSGGVPDNVSGDMSGVGSISMSGSISGATTITASGLVKTTNYLQGARLYLTDDVYLEYDASSYGVRLVGAGFWTESYISSGAPGSSSGSGVDLDRVWESLTNNTDKPNVKINVAHIPDLSWGMITSGKPTTISGYGITDAYTKAQVDNLIGSIEQFHYEIYASTSAVTTPQTNVLYLIGPTGSGSDKYEEYVYANSTWTKIGDTSIDLSPYLTVAVAAQTYQTIITDLATIRSDAANGNTAYNGLSTVSDCLQSLQEQIDSVAAKDGYDELTVTALFSDTLAATSIYAGAIYIGEDDLSSALSSLSSRATSLEGRATALEGRATALEGRATSLESRATTLEGRATTLEGKVTTLEGRADALENRATALEGRATTLESYFTNGVANSALRLSGDTAYSIWGVEYWASGVPKSVTDRPNLYVGTTQVQTSSDTQNLTGIGTISASGLATITGGISLGGLFDDEDSKLVWDSENNAWHLIGNFYADGFVSSGGPGSSSGSGVDLDRVWESLTNNTDKPNVKINESHIPDVASVYGYLKGNQTISLTGVVTGSGTTSIATSIADGALSIAKVDGLQAALDSKTGNTGTVTSVSMTLPTGLSVSGTPITTSGTLAISFAEGYSIPTTAQQSTWSGKQDAISDLTTIRSNATHGETAYNNLGNYQPLIDDLETIRSNASHGETAYNSLGDYQPLISDLATIRSNANNGQTAYSWGNHASVGYLLVTTAASTYQPIITDLSTIRSNAANGNTAYGWGNHANAGYLTSANGTTISDCFKSLQSQIDSVASKNNFDELDASVIHSDIVTATNAYVETVTGSLSGNATTASYLVSSSYGVGGGLNPVYFSGGRPVASTSTAGGASVPVYMNGGTLTAVTPSSMFSALSSSAETNLSVTIAGQNRTISDLYARYDKDGGEIAPNMTAIGSSLRSLQSQIDSVATRNNYDELTATMLFSDTISVGSNINAGGVIHSITGIYSDGYVAAGGVGSSSDRRLKDGLSRISSDRAISILMGLKPMEWTWNDKNEYLAGKNGAGLVAQDVADIVPFAVMDCGDYLSLNYSVFHAYEIASIQDHESRIKSLEKENAMLKEKVKQLEAR